MKFIILFSTLLIIFSCEKKEFTDKEVLEIIHADKNYQNLQLKSDFLTGDKFIDTIKSFRKIIVNENLKPIFQADLNGDGKLDYVVNLEYKKDTTNENIIRINDEVEGSRNSVVLLSNLKGYEVLNATRNNIYDILSIKTINYKGHNLIKILSFDIHAKDKNSLLKSDTLIVKNNQLTEFIKKESNSNISKIIFTQFGGYSPGIEYTLTLKSDSVIINSKYYKKLDGKYFGKNKNDFQNLSQFLNSIDFKNLNEHYSIGCCDHSAIETKIVYDNKKTKTIYDYAERGSFGLIKFYEKIDSLIQNQKWQKINY